MNKLLQKAGQFLKRWGKPAKFAAKLVLDVVVPGPISGLVGKVLDYAVSAVAVPSGGGIALEDALDATRDALEALQPSDMDRIERMFDLLQQDMQQVIDKLAPLENVPEQAKETLRAALATEKQTQEAALRLQELGLDVSIMKEQLLKLVGGQHEMLGLAQKLYQMQFDYMREEEAQRVAPRQLNERLAWMEAALAQLLAGRADRAEQTFAKMSQDEPASAALAVGLAVAQQAGGKTAAAAKTLGRAQRLRPGDRQLEELTRVATRLSRGDGNDTDKTRAGPMPPRPGDTLDGWLLEAALGQGGWGQVLRGRKAGVTRALKIIHPELATDPFYESRFKREIMLLAGLDSHPHLIRIDPEHSFGWAREWNCWYYVMELVEGMSLQTYLSKKGKLTFGQLQRHFLGIAEGLGKAHARGIVHRDIKPGNILVRAKDEPGKGRFVLADFGLAGGVDPNTKPAGLTALFAAPEQFRTGTTTPRSDVFSLAATIYYCLLYGDAEKEGLYDADLLHAEVSPAYRDVLKRCLSNQPAQRPKDAGEMAALLANAKESESGGERLAWRLREADEAKNNARTWEQQHNYANALQWLETVPEDLRDAAWHQSLVQRRDRVLQLDAEIDEAEKAGRFKGLRAKIKELIALQPPRAGELQEMLALLPKEMPALLTAPFSAQQAKEYQQQWAEFCECKPFESFHGIPFALIPPGTYMMGSPANEENRSSDETPHVVTLTKAFYLATTPVTQGQWRAVMGNNPSHFKGDDRPVEQVSWDDCQLFCQKLSQKLGKQVRLPTEAEWEYACRAGTTTAYYSGNGEEALRQTAWYAGNSGSELPNAMWLHDTHGNVWECGSGTHRVGQFLPNAWGLHDMHGNVWEWCRDFYDEAFCNDSPSNDPECMNGSLRVVRGGGWDDRARRCRAAFRGGDDPGYRDNDLGFRLALVPSGSE